ncbi:MAG: amidohydrolase family protein [Acidobacteriota bacterium]
MLTVAQKKESASTEFEFKDISFIDCDTHFLPMQALEKLARLHPDFFRLTVDESWVRFSYRGRIIAESRAGGEISGASEHGHLYLEKKVQDMDREDPRSVQILGFAQSICGTLYPPGVGADVCRSLNDGVADMMEKSPVRHRFIPVAAIYLPWVEASIREIQRAHKNGFKGVFLGPIREPYGDLSLGSQGIWNIYEVLNDLDMPVIYHSSNRQWKDWSSYDYKTINIPEMVGANHKALQRVGDLGLLYGLPFTYACDMAELIFSGTLDQFSNLRFCFLEGRVASYIPALMDSLNQVRLKRLSQKIQRPPSEYLQHFYPAVTANEKWLHHTVEAWPDHNMVLGSDYPHADASGTWPNSVRMIQNNSKLSDADKERILVGNARKLFHM